MRTTLTMARPTGRMAIGRNPLAGSWHDLGRMRARCGAHLNDLARLGAHLRLRYRKACGTIPNSREGFACRDTGSLGAISQGSRRDARELQLQLSGSATTVVERHHAVADRPATLLGRLQRAVQNDVAAPPERRLLEPSDRSLQVHACHGPTRQVEVLR
jgi:Exodeoxyribonuclease V, gamma subunit